MRVLLAEDTIELANVLTVVLTRNKYAVDAVYNGIDALESGLTGIYDIILLDIMMPGCPFQRSCRGSSYPGS